MIDISRMLHTFHPKLTASYLEDVDFLGDPELIASFPRTEESGRDQSKCKLRSTASSVANHIYYDQLRP